MRALAGAQQSDRWVRNRVGRVTGSRMADVMHVLKRKSNGKDVGEHGAQWEKYRLELIAERMTGRASDHVVTRYMQDGSDREAEARTRYEMTTGEMVVPVSFVLHPRYDWAGASADGLVGDNAVLELKSPKAETLLAWIESGEIPNEYVLQMMWEMACCERSEAHFFGWVPNLPPFFRIVKRDDELITNMEREAEALHNEVEAFLAKHGYPPTVWSDHPSGDLPTIESMRGSVDLLGGRTLLEYLKEVNEEYGPDEFLAEFGERVMDIP